MPFIPGKPVAISPLEANRQQSNIDHHNIRPDHSLYQNISVRGNIGSMNPHNISRSPQVEII